MVILHAFLALLAGFATMVLIVVVTTALLQKLTPDWVGATGKPNPGYVFVNLGYSFLAAAAGGYITAWIAQRNPLIHVLALAITVLLLSALSALQQRGQQPVWYMLTLVALTPLGVLAGGLVRLRVLEIL
jgi:NADH:ubiquinone oxidoreductase subunit 6 (subunit J)